MNKYTMPRQSRYFQPEGDEIEPSEIDYKFDEPSYLEELKAYIDQTYNEHYGDGKIQTTEVIIDRGRGLDFCLGNVDKYSNRYGHKGGPEDHRKDLLKIIHYGLLALYSHDKAQGDDK